MTILPVRPNLEQYHKQAKDLLRLVEAGDAEALQRIEGHRERDGGPVLADAQLTLAREHGMASWSRFKRVVELVEPFRQSLYPGDAEAVRTMLAEAPELARCEPWAGYNGKPIQGVSSGCVWHRPQQTEIAGMLVEAGADCDFTIAARAGLVDLVQKMLDEDPSLVSQQDNRGRTAMFRAGCVFGNFPPGEQIVDLLLERGAELDFYVACTFALAADVERMLAQDPALATRPDPDNMMALHWAVRPRRNDGPEAPVKITRLLLAAGADVGAVNTSEEDMQPLHHCGEWSAHPEQVDELLAAGADINSIAGNGWTPLDYAMDRGRDAMTAHLQACGGQPSGKRDN